MVAESQGRTVLPKINEQALRKKAIPVAPLNEQKRIVAKLDALQARADAAKQALDAIPPLLEKFRQSVLAAAFRGDLTREWRARNPDVEPASELLARIRAERRRRWEEANPTKKYVEPEPVDPSALPELPVGWRWIRLDEILLGIVGGKSPNTKGRPAEEGEYGVIKVSAVTWGQFDPSENKALDRVPPDSVPRVARGDLLISRANTVELVGAVVLVEMDHPYLVLSDKTLRLDLASALPKEYVLWALRTRPVRAVFEDSATGTSDSMRNISHPKIRAAPIPLPPLDEMNAIVAELSSILSSASDQATAMTQMTSLLDSLGRSTLAKAFRGELVPQDPNDEPAEVLLERIRAERAGSEGGGKKRRGRARS